MFDQVRSALASLEAVVRDFEPRVVDGRGAVTLVELFARIEHLAGAGKALAASRVDDTGIFRESGHRSAGQMLADVSGTTVGAAESTLRAVQRLGEHPVVNDAFRAGDLSETQTREISYAVSKAPDSAERLVGYVRRHRPMKGLKERCARIVAASIEDDRAWARRLHEERNASIWHDHGAVCASLQLAPDRGVRFHAAVEAETDRIFREARADGRREPRAAYMADAIANLVERGPVKPIDARLDVAGAALDRGHVVEGEQCEIPGSGPIPVTIAKQLLRDARVTVLVSDETDHISHVSSVTRTVPTKLRRWLEATYPVCGRQGCENSRDLRIDHILEYRNGGILDEHNAWRICGPCDDLKMHHGWVVVGEPGDWDLVPPDHPDALGKHSQTDDRAPP